MRLLMGITRHIEKKLREKVFAVNFNILRFANPDSYLVCMHETKSMAMQNSTAHKNLKFPYPMISCLSSNFLSRNGGRCYCYIWSDALIKGVHNFLGMSLYWFLNWFVQVLVTSPDPVLVNYVQYHWFLMMIRNIFNPSGLSPPTFT